MSTTEFSVSNHRHSPTLMIYQARTAWSYFVLLIISKYIEFWPSMSTKLPRQKINCVIDPFGFIPSKIYLIIEPWTYHSINLALPITLSCEPMRPLDPKIMSLAFIDLVLALLSQNGTCLYDCVILGFLWMHH